ncbi:MAG: phytase [Anaerolineales bacterium]|nr:phytase [Anaerolineales bacterium]
MPWNLIFALLLAALVQASGPSGASPQVTSTAPVSSDTGIAEPGLVDGIPVVTARLETHPVLDMDEPPADARMGDLDDPAIWVHPADPMLSTVVGVLKEGGLEVYDLDGQILQSLSPEGARYNNVDILYDFELGGALVDVIAITDRYRDTLVFFQVDPASRQLVEIGDPANPLLFTAAGNESDEETTAYGVALYRSPKSGTAYAIANRRETGDVAQWLLKDNGSGQIAIEQVRAFQLPIPEGGELEDAQTEGMVADQELGHLYIGQENVGIWKIDAEPDASAELRLLYSVRPEGELLEADVEGLTIYYGPDGTGYLLVSSQGDNTFAVFTREGDNAYLGSFQIGAAGEIDGVQESDGAMVLNVPLGDRFPNGLLVVQDGFNLPAVMVEDDGELENVSTSFKFVDWADVASAFDPPLMVDTTSYHPRSSK